MIQRAVLKRCVLDQTTELKSFDVGVHRVLRAEIRLSGEYITIITGVRRNGKTTLLRQIMHDLQEDYAYFNFDDPRIIGFTAKDFQKLEEIFGNVSYYFFEDIQIIPEWVRFVSKLLDKGKFICITASNLNIFSGLNLKLLERHVSLSLFPFDFYEFCSFDAVHPSFGALEKYMNMGGIPFYLVAKNKFILHQLFSDIIFKDILAKHKDIDRKILEEGITFLMSNLSKSTALTALRKKREKLSDELFHHYTLRMEQSLLIYMLPRFNWAVKAIAVLQKKIYVVDLCLARSVCPSLHLETERLFENLVYLTLRRKYTQMYYFQEKFDCDFIVRVKDKIIQAVQACYQWNEDTIHKKMVGLKEAMTYFNLNEGTIITNLKEDKMIYGDKVIHVIPYTKWVLY